MTQIGIISDTHTEDLVRAQRKELLSELSNIFKNKDFIIHAGDITDISFLKDLEHIAPIKYVSGECDKKQINNPYLQLEIESYKIGVIHQLPKDLKRFCEKKQLINGLLIYGHTHIPLIKGYQFNTLLLNPGSPAFPKPPEEIKGFDKPKARPSVIILKIENGIVSSYIVNLRFKNSNKIRIKY